MIKIKMTLKRKALEKKLKTKTMTTVIFDQIHMNFNKDDESMLISLSANVNVMHIGSFFLIRSNGNGRCDSWLGDLLHFDVPFIFWFFEVAESEFWLTIRNHKIDSIFA